MAASRLSLRALAVVAVTALLAHARSLGNGLVFDDRGAILENPVVQGPLRLGALLRTDFWGRAPDAGPGTWRPLAVLTFWLDRHVLGESYHATNLVLHAATAVMLALALSRQTKRPRFALVAASVFGALGIGSEAVASVVGRADVMAAGLCFLAWYLAGRADEKADPYRMAGSALALFDAMLCKESAIVLPLWIVLADRILAPSRAPRLASLRYLSLGAAAAASVGLRLVLFDGSLARDVQSNPLLDAGILARVWTSLRLFGMAVRRIVIPVGLSADYSYAAILPDPHPFALSVLAGALSLVGVLLVAVRLRRREPLLSLGAMVLGVAWLPLSHLPFALPTIFAERLLYLPAAGFAIAAGRLGEWLLSPRGAVPGKKKKADALPLAWRPMLSVIGPIVVLNVGLAWHREAAWQSQLALFRSAVEVTPGSARAWKNLGAELLTLGRSREAIAPLEKAAEILPTWGEPRSQLGVALYEQGRKEEAEAQLRKAVALAPDGAKTVFNLAVFLVREERLGEAVEALRPYAARHPGTREEGLLRQIEAGVGR